MARGARNRTAPATPRRTRADLAPGPSGAPNPEATPQAMGLARPPTPGGGTGSTAPVIVLTYGFAGGRRLQELISAEAALACTVSTGIVAAAGQVGQLWQNAEERDGDTLSPLAAASVRALAGPMIAMVTARAGGRRWCEIASVDPVAATVFLQAFPGTKVICLHRACPDVAFAALAAHPWGLSGITFARYLASYPASTAMALAAWWAEQAGPLLDFEAAHPQACLRVRYEDLVNDPDDVLSGIRDFLGLEPRPGDDAPVPGPPEAAPAKADLPGCGAGFPYGQLGKRLLDDVNAMHARLGYPPLSARVDKTG